MWLKEKTDFCEKHQITEKYAARFKCTAEHLQARKDGGSNTSVNIVAACRFCNMTRHKRLSPLIPSEYKILVLGRLNKGKWHPIHLN